MDRVQKWMPGDVAMATIYGHEVRVVRGHKAWITTPAPDLTEFPVTYSAIYDNSGEVKDARPLAVVDPESNDDLDLLAEMFGAIHDPLRDIRWTLRLILREFAKPTPRIEEPTGLGAVVEDDKGVKWLLVVAASGPYRWAKSGEIMGDWFRWSNITAVRVLSEGVPAEADR